MTQQLLLQYADGALSPEENRQVELHLADCAFCDEALEGILLCGTQAFATMVHEVTERVEALTSDGEEGKVIEFRPHIQPPVSETQPAATTPRTGFKRMLPFLGIAASLAVIATLGILLLGADSAGKIADTHFQLLDSGTRRSIEDPSRGIDDVVEAYDEAMNHFAQQNYKAAAPLFDKDHSSKAKLYAGDCYFMLKNYSLAAMRYKSVIEAQNGWEEQAEFNLALTFLKMDEVAQARMVLEKISLDGYHDFQKEAKETLDEVLGL